MIKQPPYLKKGDKIAIVCLAKKLLKPIDKAIKILTDWGLEVVLGDSVYASHHQFAGTDRLRAQDLQKFLNDAEIKAIISGRGGYGTIRLIDDVDFTAFKENPKWIVGFSDITVLLSHLIATTQTQCIHAQMPSTFEESTPEALASLRKSLFGERQNYHCNSHQPNKMGSATGTLIGGNLTLLSTLMGSESDMDFNDKILFLEDVGEQEYSIDRMMRMLKRAGKLAQLKGLIVGAFTEIKEEKTAFGQTVAQVILDVVKDYDYPVCFDFPVGHIANNLSMVLGASVCLTVKKNQITLNYL